MSKDTTVTAREFVEKEIMTHEVVRLQSSVFFLKKESVDKALSMQDKESRQAERERIIKELKEIYLKALETSKTADSMHYLNGWYDAMNKIELFGNSEPLEQLKEKQ